MAKRRCLESTYWQLLDIVWEAKYQAWDDLERNNYYGYDREATRRFVVYYTEHLLAQFWRFTLEYAEQFYPEDAKVCSTIYH